MLLIDDVDKLLHKIGMLDGEVVVLVQVGFEIIEMGVALLCGIVPKERWNDGKSVEIVGL